VVAGAAKDMVELRIDAPTTGLVVGALIKAVVLRVLGVIVRVIELVVGVVAVTVSLVVVNVEISDCVVVVLFVVIAVVAMALEVFDRLVVVVVLVVVIAVVPVAVELFDWLVVTVLVTIPVFLLVPMVLPISVVPAVAIFTLVPAAPLFVNMANVSVRVLVDITGGDVVRVVEETAVVDGNCVPAVAMQIWLYSIPATSSDVPDPPPELAALVPSQRLSPASTPWVW